MRSAVLLSGGLDSAVLLADEASRAEVQPIYVAVGLAWEAAEREVVSRGIALGVPFEWTLSCMNPLPRDHVVHCGVCSKCRERHDAFVEAGLRDPTKYANTTNLASRSVNDTE